MTRKDVNKLQEATLFSMRKESKELTVKRGFIYKDSHRGARMKFMPYAEDEDVYLKSVFVMDNPYELYSGALYVIGEPDIDRVARIFLEWKLQERDKHKKRLEDINKQIEYLNKKTLFWKESEEKWND